MQASESLQRATKPIEQVRVLQRRIEWLNKRIKKIKVMKACTKHDVAERDALMWALDMITEWAALPADVEDELVWFFEKEKA